MAKFFVGQRVRLVGEWLSNPLENPRGKEGVIFDIGEFKSMTGRQYEYRVHVQGRLYIVLANSNDLEPILPEGHQPVEISKLLTEFPELGQVLAVSA